MAASALSWLCSPVSAHSRRATLWPRCSTSKAPGSPWALKSLTTEPKLETSLQQPWCSTRVMLSSRSEEHTSELQSQSNLVCRLLLEKKKTESCCYDNPL